MNSLNNSEDILDLGVASEVTQGSGSGDHDVDLSPRNKIGISDE